MGVVGGFKSAYQYSLVVSLEVDSNIDIYSEVAQQIGIETEPMVEIPVS